METLAPELVIAAYRRGYFPMAEPGSGEIGWYRTARRAVFLPGDAHVSRSLNRVLKQERFQVAINRDFGAVIAACARRDETWISAAIISCYSVLHENGIAHSVEAYNDGRLVGGLYGVALGGAFFGESMFHHLPDASKVAFATLCRRLDERGFLLHDAQFMTPHLARLGAREVFEPAYLRLLREALRVPCRFA
ncbi:MAG: leucyl/phenylalanyl-tRNA--protein transferase [Dehalococcoidia bacterium]